MYDPFRGIQQMSLATRYHEVEVEALATREKPWANAMPTTYPLGERFQRSAEYKRGSFLYLVGECLHVCVCMCACVCMYLFTSACVCAVASVALSLCVSHSPPPQMKRKTEFIAMITEQLTGFVCVCMYV